MNDLELIKYIKESDTPDKYLNELYERHSGIYYRMINSYVPKNSAFADKQELIDDAKYYVYCAALDYDETKKTKFSTYLGNKTRWMCLNKYNKSKRTGEIAQEEEVLERLDYANNNFMEIMINQELIDKIFKSIQDIGDERAYEIFTMRYIIGNKNKVMPWKEIGKKMNLSIQGCINIHNSFIKKIKSKKID